MEGQNCRCTFPSNHEISLGALKSEGSLANLSSEAMTEKDCLLLGPRKPRKLIQPIPRGWKQCKLGRKTSKNQSGREKKVEGDENRK